jgi:transposase
MKQAVEAIEKRETSVRKAAELYGVPRSTLHDKVSGKTAEDARSGPQSYLSLEEEEELTSFLLQAANIGFTPILESKFLHWCNR